MLWELPLMPQQASTIAEKVDALYLFLWGLTAFFTLLIFVLILVFAVKYKRGKVADRSNAPDTDHKLEAVWIVVPLAISLVIFGWATSIFFEQVRPPADAVEYFATGKQWMWKFQSPEGKREVNELHVPKGRNIKVTMTSEDVLHDLFFPAFRTKADVLPGRYTNVWFNATKTGTFHIFCAEYCGMQHSLMIGKVIVMEPDEYERWLTSAASGTAGQATADASETPAQAGERLFTQYGCQTCHQGASGTLGPSLAGVYGSEVELQNGEKVKADDDYMRESILNSSAKIVKGYQGVMPNFKGQISEEEVMNLIAYIKAQQGSGATAQNLTPTGKR